MKRALIGAGLALLAALGLVYFRPTPVPELPAAGAFALVDVTVIDPASEAPRPHMTVLVRDQRIVAVGQSDSIALDAGVTRVAGAGKYVMPGLWDMHVHNIFSEHLRSYVQPLLVANGVTGVRVMDTELLPDEIGHKAEPRWEPSALSPRAVIAGRAVNGAGGVAPTSYVLRTPADARAAVDSMLTAGSEFVKVFNNVPAAAYFELISYARAKSLRVAGHLPWEVSPVEAADSGQDDIEHLNGLLRGCSTRAAEFQRTLIAVTGKDSAQDVERRTTLEAGQAFDDARCRDLVRRFAAHDTWITPTLVTLEKRTLADAPSVDMEDRALKYMPGWEAIGRANARWAARPRAGEQKRISQLRWTRALEIVRLLRDGKVHLLAGTDITSAPLVPGFSLHDELGLLTKAGLTPREALYTATVAPVVYFNAQDSLGAVAAGKIADLVLLSASPFADINNTRRIDAVVLRGRFLDRTFLDGALHQTARRARRESIVSQVRGTIQRGRCALLRRGRCTPDSDTVLE